jgi:hypothetical protein
MKESRHLQEADRIVHFGSGLYARVVVESLT